MNKFLKKFIKVVYYLLVIAFGVILTISLPYVVLNNKLTKIMNKHIENGEFVDAMHMIGCYYDSDTAFYYEETNSNTKLVMFRATPFVDTEYKTVDESGNEVTVVSQETLEIGYFGFLCNVKETYNFSSEKENTDFKNKTKLVVNDNVEISLLDYDNNRDGKLDSILTLLNGDYLTFTISTTDVEKIDTIKFIDKDGLVFLNVDVKSRINGPLTFNHQFFKAYESFIPKYNNLAKDRILKTKSDEELMQIQETLSVEATNIIENNPGFTVGKFDEAIGSAQTTSYILTIVYFVCALILGDLLVGKRTTITVIKVLLRPITKRLPKKENVEAKKVLEDYYSQVVISLNITNDPNLNAKLCVSHNDLVLEFDFNKDNEFISKKRIHAGVYNNLVFTCEGYKVLNLPEFIEAKGFKTEINLELEKE